MAFVCDICGSMFSSKAYFVRHKNKHGLDKKYRCDHCNESFNVHKNLELHQSIHNANELKCPKCGIIFSRLSSFQGHVQTHYESEHFLCRYCEEEFLLETGLKTHIRLKHSKTSESASNEEEPDAHLKPFSEQRNKNKPPPKEKISKCYTCDICTKSFNKPSLLERHLKVHTKEKPYKCEYCDKSFNQKTSLKIHKFKHDGTKPTQCLKCGLRFSQKGNLKLHMKRVHANKVLPNGNKYPCQQCSCIFKKLGSLTAHTNRRHPTAQTIDTENIDSMRIGDFIGQIAQINTVETQTSSSDSPKYAPLEETVAVTRTELNSCSYCPKKFKKPSDFLRHLRIHLKKKPFECHYCKHRFTLKNTLQNHLKTHFCKICNECFDSSKLRDNHIRTTHIADGKCCKPKEDELRAVDGESENPVSLKEYDNSNRHGAHICQICNAEFKKSSELKQHAATHAGFQPFNCQYCNKSFGTRNTLTRHVNTHTFERVLQCTQCELTFSTTGSLKKHMMQHSDDKNFACPYCDESFKCYDSCMSHIEAHKNEKPNEEESVDSLQIEPEDPPLSSEIVIKDSCPAESSLIDLSNLENYVFLIDQQYFVFNDMQPSTIESNEAEGPIVVESIANEKIIELNELLGENEKEIQSMAPLQIDPSTPFENIISQSTVIPNYLVAEENVLNGDDCEIRVVQPTDPDYEDPISQQIKKTCEFCTKQFVKPIDLRRHLRTHTGEKPFKCSLCDKTFSLKSTLTTHIKIHSENKETLPCHVCSKTFSSKSSFLVHMRIHTGEKPFKCHYCPLKFRTSGHCFSHFQCHIKLSKKIGIPPNDTKTRSYKLLQYLNSEEMMSVDPEALN